MPDRPAFTPDQSIDLAWGRFSYSDTGGGKPVLLIHGNGRLRTDWDRILGDLAGRRLIRPDLRGHGGSSVPKEAFGLADLADDVLALADALWLGRFDLVGHSLGGMLGLALLDAHSDRVDRVALVEGWTALRYMRALGEDVQEGLDPESDHAIKAFYRETVVRWPPLLRDQFWETVEAFDGRGVLEQTARPILELYGDRGRQPPTAEALGIPARPNIELAWIAGGTHFLPLTHPASTGRELRRFLINETNTRPPPGPPPTLRDLGMRR